nr:hypothetical protein CFP56_12369 [Quercus suber]
MLGLCLLVLQLAVYCGVSSEGCKRTVTGSDHQTTRQGIIPSAKKLSEQLSQQPLIPKFKTECRLHDTAP